jgi:hypothetical protein
VRAVVFLHTHVLALHARTPERRTLPLRVNAKLARRALPTVGKLERAGLGSKAALKGRTIMLPMLAVVVPWILLTIVVVNTRAN